MKKHTLLWLDDYRNPFENNWQTFSPIPHKNVVWVQSYTEFVDWIEKNGLPGGICFDHDLAGEHYHKSMFEGPEAYAKAAEEFKEKTGMDCAKWLVEYCISKKRKLPLYNIQSANPAGKANIDGLLKSFIKHQES